MKTDATESNPMAESKTTVQSEGPIAAKTDTRQLVARTPTRRPSAARRKRVRNVITFLIALAVVIAIWQWVGSSGIINPMFSGSPAGVIESYRQWFGDQGTGWTDVRATLFELGVGFGLAILVGIPLGILLGWYRSLDAVLGPFIDFFYAMPHVALVPIIIIWFGIDSASKIVLVFFSAIFPVLVNTISGVRTTEGEFLTLGKAFMANTLQLMWSIVLPAAIPAIFTGIRLALGKALVSVVVAEMFAGSVGIGFQIRVAGNTFQTNMVFAGIILTALAGVIGSLALGYASRYFDRWRPAPAE